MKIDFNAFAQDFASFLAHKENRQTPRVSLVTVPDEQWDQMVEVTKPYEHATTNDLRVGFALSVKQPLGAGEVPDLVKTLFPDLAEAMLHSDLIVGLNLETLTHLESDPEQAFYAGFINVAILVERGLEQLGYSELDPLADNEAFGHSQYCKPERYARPQ